MNEYLNHNMPLGMTMWNWKDLKEIISIANVEQLKIIKILILDELSKRNVEGGPGAQEKPHPAISAVTDVQPQSAPGISDPKQDLAIQLAAIARDIANLQEQYKTKESEILALIKQAKQEKAKVLNYGEKV